MEKLQPQERYTERDFQAAIRAQRRWKLREQARGDMKDSNPVQWNEVQIQRDIDGEREDTFRALKLII